ncbi:MAG: polysaccharide biosynthesis/export family protein, partial [Pirellulaceae bacterium]|nr:polysaccharide biosynthesis/export family protein [Pirellulaceae bacterium]
MIYLPYVGGVRASNRTVKTLQDDLVNRYKEFYKHSTITVTPIRTNTKLDDLRSTVDSRAAASGGQGVQEMVAPDGSISLPSIGRVAVQGLTLEELMREINERYSEIVDGLEVTPALRTPAPRMAYVLGEVTNPGAVAVNRPTTAMMAIAQAGGWRHGGNLRQIVIFRRTADWRLIATKVDLQGALWGKSPAPSDELWLSDSDIVLVPKSKIQIADDY